MEYRRLTSDGPELSVLGLGAWPIGGGMGRIDEKTAVSTIHAAIDNGITTIDTAQYYRTSESIIGKALRKGYRSRCFIATKASYDFSRKGIISAIENSFRVLETDYIDLYQLHNWNPQYSIEESMETMLRLREQGKARYIGVSNFNVEQMEKALQAAGFESNQLRYNMFDRRMEKDVIPCCERRDIGVLAHSPLAKGLLTGKYTTEHRFPQDDERSTFPRFRGVHFAAYLGVVERLTKIAQAKGLSMVQLAIAWILRKPAITCVLVGAKNVQQVREHLGGLGVEFNSEELRRIDRLLADAPDVPHS
jgi:aryl-alcohol dehydrogenase-like predicted oxidoreductase